MEYLTVEEFRKTQQPYMGEAQVYKELQSGNIRSIRTSRRGKYLIPVSEVVLYRKRLLRDAVGIAA